MHILSITLGLLGDFFTFLGGSFLAWDAIFSKSQHKRGRKYKLALTDPLLAGRVIEIEGMDVEKPEEVDEVFIHFASRRAKIGFSLVTIGFLLLLAHRIIELCI